jgi:hypothetical protein
MASGCWTLCHRERENNGMTGQGICCNLKPWEGKRGAGQVGLSQRGRWSFSEGRAPGSTPYYGGYEEFRSFAERLVLWVGYEVSP